LDRSKTIGIITWILIAINYIPVKKEHGYLSQKKEFLIRSSEFLKNLPENCTDEEFDELYEKEFND
jgi:hypothetical protein